MLGAAVFSGADAVYLGLTGFNARRTAGNFTPDELREAVAFCHGRGVRVHVTLNTLVYGRELAGLADAVRAVAEAGGGRRDRRRSGSRAAGQGHRPPRCTCTAPPR